MSSRPRAARALVVAAVVALATLAAPNAQAVVNGERVPEGERTFMAALLSNGSQFCGGSVVAADVVVTAAHCVANRTSTDGLSVAVGATDYTEGTRIAVSAIHVHPDYEDDSSLDIAILELASAVPDEVAFITLAEPAHDHLEAAGTPVVVAGWGSQTPLVGQLPPLDDDLYEVELEVVADEDFECDASEPENTVCASDFLEDSCQGDSGGPLFADLAGGEVQIGIVSRGVGCAVPEFAGWYTEVNATAVSDFVAPFLSAA